MDLARLVLTVEALVVFVLYATSLVRMGVALRHARTAEDRWKQVGLGRALRFLGVVLIAIACIEGYIELWGEPITPRLYFAEAAFVAWIMGWVLVERHVDDRDLLDLGSRAT